jgi:hypothetical protein
MNSQHLENDSLLDPLEMRAENRLRQNRRWNTIDEGILIPCGFVFVLLFFVLAGMLVNYLNSRYP